MRTHYLAGIGLAFTAVAAVPARAAISICNDFSAPIHVAFAAQKEAGYTAAGWWSAAPNSCADADFAFDGGALYYTADSDWYREGRSRKRDHWGNKLKLYVSKAKFSNDDAEKSRRGASAEMFSSADIGTVPAGKTLTITVRFHSGGTTIQSTTK